MIDFDKEVQGKVWFVDTKQRRPYISGGMVSMSDHDGEVAL